MVSIDVMKKVVMADEEKKRRGNLLVAVCVKRGGRQGRGAVAVAEMMPT